MNRFEPIPNARHRTEVVDGTEWFVVRARKNWFALPFLCVWLTFWTLGGGTAFYGLMTGQMGERVFLVVWLIGWAFGWIFAAGSILWQLGGRSMIAVADGALIHAWRMPFISRQKQYDARQIRDLRSGDSGGLFGFARSMGDMPPFLPSKLPGSIRFDYGARTIQLFPGLDESEGRMIVARLASRLPKSAMASA